jgi:tetraacyldisaccharide 4'-kinase
MSQPFSVRRLLFPLIPLYRLALALRELRFLTGLEQVRRLRFPVVSIGNLSTGGSGKTPLTIALARALLRRGLRVDVLSRGYGRQSQWVSRVDENGSAEDFGDEPLLIACVTGVPVYVAPQRYDAGQLAEANATAEAEMKAEAEARQLASQPEPDAPEPAATQSEEPDRIGEKPPAPTETPAQTDPSAQTEPVLASIKPELPGLNAGDEPAASAGELAPEAAPAEQSPAETPSPAEEQEEAKSSIHVHLLDDGFQHRQLARDVNILLLNQRDWQDWLLPAGNLREPVAAISRADVLALPANQPELEVALRLWGWEGPIWRLVRSLEITAINGPVAAFCGIAHPDQFFEGLEEAGLEVALRLSFPDHYTYTAGILEELIAQARNKNVTAVITTEKDLVRMGNLALTFPRSMPLTTARLRIKIEDQDAAIDWLINRLTPMPPHPPL